MATLEFDKEFSRRIIRHEQHVKWSVVAFALAVVVALVMWMSFLRYL